MKNEHTLKATLINPIPQDRYRVLAANTNPPKVGDIVGLDQGFTNAKGEPMVLVYCVDAGGVMLYEAEVYESELSC